MEVFEIPNDLIEKLKQVGRRHGVTLYMTLLAAYHAQLHLYSGEEDIIVGGVTDLRRRPELENVVGYFLNTIALRAKPKGETRFSDFLTEVRDSVLGALAASEAPFDEVVRALDVKRQPGTHPLFNCLFSIEPPVDPFPDGWDLTQMDVVVGGAKFDLYLELDERQNEGMHGRFLYSTELFDPATVRRMIGHYLTILEGVVADATLPLKDLPLLGETERQQLLVEWNDTAVPLSPAMLPDAFRAQVAARPDAIAIRFGDQSGQLCRARRPRRRDRRDACMRRGSSRAIWSASASTARPTWSPPCSRCIGSARRICRSIPISPRRGSIISRRMRCRGAADRAHG